MEKVLVIGGLGFVGYHIVNELQSRNYLVNIGSRSAKDDMYAKAPIVHFDLKGMTDEQLESVINDFDHVIFAGGADDRTIPKGNAEAFFYNENVVTCVRLIKICNRKGVKKMIILGSYFSHFNREKPEWKMAEHHVYVKSRKLQQEESEANSDGSTAVVTLELPYIFGATPGRTPLWKPLVKYVKSIPVLFYTSGGTNMVSVESVAQATFGAIEYAKHKDRWIVGGDNISWKDMLGMFSRSLGKKRIVITVPTFIVRFFSSLVSFFFKVSGKQTGLNLFHFISTQSANTYLDTEDSMKVLKYSKSNIQKAIDDTVRSCGY